MRRLSPPLRFLIFTAAAVCIAVGAVAVWQRHLIAAIIENRDVLMEGVEWADKVNDADGLVEFMAANPSSFSWVMWDAGNEQTALAHDADTPRSLASTVKIVVLSAYARAVEQGTIDPDTRVPLSEWDALYLPGTDGGTHPRALADLESRGGIVDEHAPLHEIARAMIVFSDNAATDLLILRLGRERIEAEIAALSLPAGNDPPYPLAGSKVLAASPPEGTLPMQWMEELVSRGRAHIRDESWRFAQRLVSDVAFRKLHRERLERDGVGLNLKELKFYANHLVARGTARGYARVMEAVITAPSSSRWAYVMAQALEWPLARSERIRHGFDRYGTKGGSLPGVITAAYFAKPRGQSSRVMALFFDDMPIVVWSALMKSYVQQDLERRLLEDPDFARTFAQKLGETRDGG